MSKAISFLHSSKKLYHTLLFFSDRKTFRSTDNAKYGMENKKDPSNPASYANKGKDTDKILLQINEEFLSGEGFKAGRN
ncbi:hypothetical protein [Dendronalium sp. ChiSLP03b]|uniref:hypothetical protein n=1 Tax=Dendronalium sp. ChiSLP03b TaxID=3075381 RepID=UPI002AD2540D|nr:hypothetical protein [Dendronalium sp. ChiSLP03b]MDZ8208539.1 hypothetical protein [Dendronalium sp. ChiSLP03b]